MVLETLSVAGKRVHVAPPFIREQSELIVANLSRVVNIHESVKLLNVLEAYLKSEKVDGLSKFID